jgi:uncharacterized membrane protein YraQ (UPF0718 family)
VPGGRHLIPTQRNARVIEAHLAWNYTTWLNLAFLALAAVLVIRFLTTGGLSMLRMMGGQPATADRQEHEHRPRR